MKVIIDEKIHEKCNNISIGSIEAQVVVREENEELWKIIDEKAKEIEVNVPVKQISTLKNISDSRSAYKAFGKDPSRYRLSSEALYRRVARGLGLYRVNNVVDINNLISLESAYSVGTYDLDKLSGDIHFTIADEGETYEGIGKGDLNIANLPVFYDDKGKFGSTTSDSVRAMITVEAKHILMNIISFNGDSELEKYMDEACELLEKYAFDKILSKEINKW
ncbi:MAG: phenylalanine--tRNA ligase beta subunit-related protein [Terrisporobacter sp.]|uniref:B3/B4 domain-containing protein n=1 Tax=Terrisporobacter sp. TaxID=1965305 RepID=UPI002FCAFB5E